MYLSLKCLYDRGLFLISNYFSKYFISSHFVLLNTFLLAMCSLCFFININYLHYLIHHHVKQNISNKIYRNEYIATICFILLKMMSSLKPAICNSFSDAALLSYQLTEVIIFLFFTLMLIKSCQRTG